jgi:hypothetical protein
MIHIGFVHWRILAGSDGGYNLFLVFKVTTTRGFPLQFEGMSTSQWLLGLDVVLYPTFLICTKMYDGAEETKQQQRTLSFVGSTLISFMFIIYYIHHTLW